MILGQMESKGVSLYLYSFSGRGEALQAVLGYLLITRFGQHSIQGCVDTLEINISPSMKNSDEVLGITLVITVMFQSRPFVIGFTTRCVKSMQGA